MRERDFRAYVRIGIRVYTDRMLTGLIYIMPLAYECVCGWREQPRLQGRLNVCAVASTGWFVYGSAWQEPVLFICILVGGTE